VEVMIRAMRKRLSHHPRTDIDNSVLFEICEGFKALMNNGDGMAEVTSTEGAIDVLTMCLDFGCTPLARMIMEILAVTCYYADPAIVKVSTLI
jgi:hypothetical protein